MCQSNSPPALFHRFFRWFCHPKLLKYIEGDLMELYEERVKEKGKRKADWRFAVDVLLLFRPGIIRPAEGYKDLNTYGMYKSYFKIGWRNLMRNKGYSLINIGGLALGMAVALMIGLWVHDELSFNRYFTNYDRIAQVALRMEFEGRKAEGQKYLSYPLIHELETSYKSKFKHVVPISGSGGWSGVLSTSDKMLSKTGMYIGEEAPEMFSWKMVYGNWSGLEDQSAIVISQSTAQALFGDEDPTNKSIRISSAVDAMVTGVYEDFPKNTEFYGIDFFQPWKFYLADASWIVEQRWDNHFLWAYVEIAPNTTFETVAADLREGEIRIIRNLDYMKDYIAYNPEITLLPMHDWHLYSEYKEGVLQNGPAQVVWIIGAIGIFVLVLACINFMNLSTARSEKRAKEVGIRKTIGSVRRQLVGQYFTESFLVVVLAFIFALLIVVLYLPWFNQLAAKNIVMPWTQGGFWVGSICFIALTGIVAGSYPALYLSSFNPVKVLKGAFRSDGYTSLPRKILVVVQFTVSIMLMVCTFVIYSQLMFAKERPVGYSRDGLMLIRKKSDEFNKKADVLRAELKNTGFVTDIAEAGGLITQAWSKNGGFTWKGKDPEFGAQFATLNVSPEYGKTVGWEFIDGRDLSAEIASDSMSIVINESAVKYMSLENPVGEIVHWKNNAWEMDNDLQIVGVIRDMMIESPFQPVKPAIYFTSGYKRWMLLRISPGATMSEAIPKIGAVFTSIIPDIPFDYKFADEEFAAKFATEERIGKLAAIFSSLAIGISCLGLLGLASFVAEQRTKEIGIRKVLGASVASLWSMLSREFILLVLMACLIAIPLSWYLMSGWLQQYEYRTELSWYVFIAVSVGALMITLLTVSFHAIKASVVNPIRSLRSE